MTPGESRGGIVIDDLSSRKSQNGLRAGGGLREKKKKMSKNETELS